MVASPLPDVRTVQAFKAPYYQVTIDWQLLVDGTLDDTQALATAVVVALGTDGLADIDDELPDPDSTDRAGWWGDYQAEQIWNGWPIGSKIWLLRRSAIRPVQSLRGATVSHVRMYLYQAIQPFVDLRIISRFDGLVERVDTQRIDALVRLFKGPTPVIDMRYSLLWDEQQQASSEAL
jgi:phage gp46-like protein